MTELQREKMTLFLSSPIPHKVSHSFLLTKLTENDMSRVWLTSGICLTLSSCFSGFFWSLRDQFSAVRGQRWTGQTLTKTSAHSICLNLAVKSLFKQMLNQFSVNYQSKHNTSVASLYWTTAHSAFPSMHWVKAQMNGLKRTIRTIWASDSGLKIKFQSKIETSGNNIEQHVIWCRTVTFG